MESPGCRLLTERDGRVELHVRAAPGSSRDGIRGLHGGALKLAVRAPPERGRANQALVDLLARALELRPSQVELVSGETSRDKVFALSGASIDELARRLSDLLASDA